MVNELTSIWNIPIGKKGLPFQNITLRLSREFSTVTNHNNVYHSQSEFPGICGKW